MSKEVKELIEENMYVRTKTGIHQIYRIDNNKTKYKYLYKLKKQDGDGCIDCSVLSSEDILKASHSLLGDDKEDGIIEVGDYVNGVLITNISEDNKGKYVFGYSKDGFEGEMWFYNNEIENIVTKEQFESMVYKVV